MILPIFTHFNVLHYAKDPRDHSVPVGCWVHLVVADADADQRLVGRCLIDGRFVLFFSVFPTFSGFFLGGGVGITSLSSLSLTRCYIDDGVGVG